MTMMKNFLNRNTIIHLLCWGIVLFLPLLFSNSPNDDFSQGLRRWFRSLGGPLSCMLVFYVNYLWLVPKFYFSNRKVVFYIANIALIATAVGMNTQWWSMVDHWMNATVPRRAPRPPRGPVWFYNTMMLVLVAGVSLAVRMAQRWTHIEQARKEAEQSRTKAELSNLRNQLNPHFLLNTLNNIYALIAFDSEKAQQAVEELSRLLRHVLYDNRQNFVPLYKEVAFIKDYIELMKIRLTSNVDVVTDIDTEQDDATPVAPMIFISLIENAFKHGISPQGDGHIHIAIHQADGVITCEIRNSNHPKRDNDKSGSGIGLEQVARRLELNYENQYTWDHGTTPDGKEYFSRITVKTH